MKLTSLLWASTALCLTEVRPTNPSVHQATTPTQPVSNAPANKKPQASPYMQRRLSTSPTIKARRSSSTPTDPMYQLSNDTDFNFEILRDLALAPYSGADIGEVLVAANKIVGGSFESFYAAFHELATSVHDTAQAIDPRYGVSVREAMFRTSTYFRSADFYLHGNWSDPRIYSLWDKQIAAFDVALGLLDVPGVRITLEGSVGDLEFEIPCIWYSCGLPGPRPTIILGTGYDGAQEELYHLMGAAALSRGINVITYEGPGQESVRRYQNLGFIPEWERVITPIVDLLCTLDADVDADAIGLVGISFGGWLAPRAAAFEHRLAAVVAIDGVYDFGNATTGGFPPEFKELIAQGNRSAVNYLTYQDLVDPSTPTEVIWGIEQGMWAFNAPTPYDWYTMLPPYTLEPVVRDIQCPVFVGDSEGDMFFPGQPQFLADALGDLATLHKFTSASGAGDHGALGASVLQNQVVFDWFMTLVGYDPSSSDGDM